LLFKEGDYSQTRKTGDHFNRVEHGKELVGSAHPKFYGFRFSVFSFREKESFSTEAQRA
jgi:hypothetical protein